MAEMHSQAFASSPIEFVPNSVRYTFNNLYICDNWTFPFPLFTGVKLGHMKNALFGFLTIAMYTT